MGTDTSNGSHGTIDLITGIHKGQVFSGARGECLEDAHSGVKVQIGCGHKPWKGWVNVDGVRARQYADVLTDRLDAIPLQDGFADVVVSIHVIEHVYPWEARDVIQEWLRILKPGGQLIVECPCMDKVFTYIYEAGKRQLPMSDQMTWWALWGDPKYRDVAMCHKWGYSQQKLRALLEEAGVTDITFEEPRYHIQQRDMRVTARKG